MNEYIETNRKYFDEVLPIHLKASFNYDVPSRPAGLRWGRSSARRWGTSAASRSCSCRFTAVFGDGDVIGQCRTSEHPQIQRQHDVPFHAGRRTYASRGVEFEPVALAVIERQRVQVEPLLFHDRQYPGRIQPAPDQAAAHSLCPRPSAQRSKSEPSSR